MKVKEENKDYQQQEIQGISKSFWVFVAKKKKKKAWKSWMFKQKVEKNYEIIIPSFYPFPFSIFIPYSF